MSNDSKTERQSNIEILRIVAMLMIVMFHIVNNCMRQQIINPSVNELVDGTLFHEPVFYRRLLIPETIMTFGKTGDCIFMLITGYFLGGGVKST